jgi:nitrogenase molybdenum-cofactor synthesis protein NifE
MINSLQTLNKISNIKTNSDIMGKLQVQSSGVLCPLHGVVLCGSLIKDVAILMVGAAECLWYAKGSSLTRRIRKDFKYFYSYVMDENDLVYGCARGITAAAGLILAQTEITSLIIVSSCVPELIGEDLEGLAAELRETTGKLVLPVHTANYTHKCHDYFEAVARTMFSFHVMLKPQIKRKNTVNLIGRIFHGCLEGTLEQTEPGQMLIRHGVQINLAFPSCCTTTDIEKLPAAALNIVTDRVGLPLAQYMEKQYSIPYVLFEATLAVAVIAESYARIGKILSLNWDEATNELHSRTRRLMETTAKMVEGKRVVSGCLPPDPFQSALFLAELGMHPLLISAARLSRGSKEAVEKLLALGHDPYVTHACDREPLIDALPLLKPEFYVGHADPAIVKELGIKHLGCFLHEPDHLGYAAVIDFLNRLQTGAQAESSKSEADYGTI